MINNNNYYICLPASKLWSQVNEKSIINFMWSNDENYCPIIVASSFINVFALWHAKSCRNYDWHMHTDTLYTLTISE